MDDDGRFEPSRNESLAAVAVGSVAMTVTGLQPLMLGALATAGRVSGDTAHAATLVELLCMGVSIALAGLLLPPRRLRLIGLLATLAYAALNLATAFTPGGAVIVLRALAGGASGLMIWITIGMLARRGRPEPWAAAFFMAQAVGQLVFAALGAVLVLPSFGVTGGLAFTGATALLAAPACFALPRAYPALSGPRLPSGRGLAGMLAILLFVGAGAGVWFHMRDFARDAGLSGAVLPSMAVVATLVGQIAGVGVAVALVERFKFSHAFLVVCALTLGAWAVVALRPPAIGFVAAFAVSGFAGMVLGAWLFSFLVQVEPSRRAASISACAQLCGAALGPVLGAGLPVCMAMVLASLALVWWLQRDQRMELAAIRP